MNDRGGKTAQTWADKEEQDHPERLVEDQRRIEVFARASGSDWSLHTYGPRDVVELPSLGATFPADELYDIAGIAAE